MAHITEGNVFEDLGLSREEATDLAMKVDLARDVRNFIERQELTQVQAAEFFEVPRAHERQHRRRRVPRGVRRPAQARREVHEHLARSVADRRRQGR